MKTHRPHQLVPAVLLALLVGSGCHQTAAAAPAEPLPQRTAPFAAAPVLNGTPDVAALVAKVNPAVVSITTVMEKHVSATPFQGFEDMFPFFGGRIPSGPNGPMGPNGGDQIRRQQALGSGFIVDDKGHVVTNAHVIDGATKVKITLADEREYSAKVVGKDDRLDVALLEIEHPPKDLAPASLGRSDALRVGEYVVAIGNPFGLGDTVTMGIVSAKGRSIGAGPYDDFIQTDASINPGNSGGPLFDLHGQVIGINTAINPNGKGIGFAIPIDAVKNVLPQLLATGHVTRGRIGVVIQGMDEDLAKAMGLERSKGALVGDVQAGGPAAAAGIKSGDVIVSVDGKPVAHSEELPRMIASHKPGTHVKLGVLRDKQTREVDVTLAELKDEGDHATNDRSGSAQPNEKSKLGIAVGDQDGHAVVQRVVPGGPAEGKLRPGDVIEEIDRKPVAGASDLAAKAAAAPSDKPILLRVKRGNESHFVAIAPRAS